MTTYRDPRGWEPTWIIWWPDRSDDQRHTLWHRLTDDGRTVCRRLPSGRCVESGEPSGYGAAICQRCWG